MMPADVGYVVEYVGASPAISRNTGTFPQSSFPRLLYVVASSSSTSKSILGTLKQVLPSSLNAKL